MAHHDREARPLNLVRPEVPVELAAVVARMMAKEPKRRFQTPKEVAQALKPFVKPASGSPERSKPEISRAVGPGAGRQAPGVFPELTQVSTDPTASPRAGGEEVVEAEASGLAREPELPSAARAVECRRGCGWRPQPRCYCSAWSSAGQPFPRRRRTSSTIAERPPPQSRNRLTSTPHGSAGGP